MFSYCQAQEGISPNNLNEILLPDIFKAFWSPSPGSLRCGSVGCSGQKAMD